MRIGRPMYTSQVTCSLARHNDHVNAGGIMNRHLSQPSLLEVNDESLGMNLKPPNSAAHLVPQPVGCRIHDWNRGNFLIRPVMGPSLTRARHRAS